MSLPLYDRPHPDRPSAMLTWRSLMKGEGGVFHDVHGEGKTYMSDCPKVCLKSDEEEIGKGLGEGGLGEEGLIVLVDGGDNDDHNEWVWVWF